MGAFCFSLISDQANATYISAIQKVSSDLLSQKSNTLIAMRISVAALGLFLISIALLTIIGNIENRRSQRTVILQSPHGDILVSLSAIEDFSRVVKNEVKGVKDISSRVTANKKGLTVSAKVALYSDRSVADVTQEVQESIIKYIQYTLGIDAPVKPTITVSKVVYKTADDGDTK